MSARYAAAVAAVAMTLAGCGAGSAMAGLHEAPAQVTTTAAVTTQSAREIALRVMTEVQAADSASSAEAKPLRARAMTGTALAAANAASQIGATSDAASETLTR